MEKQSDFLPLVHEAAKKKILYLPHAVRQMSRLKKMITTLEVQQVVERGEIIEHYPEDIRGHSCLVLGFGEDHRPIHVICSPKDEYLAVITAYIPDEKLWRNDFRERRS